MTGKSVYTGLEQKAYLALNETAEPRVIILGGKGRLLGRRKPWSLVRN
jgi:hypothetical protein